MTPLSKLKIGETALIRAIQAPPSVLNRFTEMGLALDSSVRLLSKLPFGGNLVILSEYGKYTLRRGTAQQIQVDPVAQ